MESFEKEKIVGDVMIESPHELLNVNNLFKKIM
jgi:hypothetical protein